MTKATFFFLFLFCFVFLKRFQSSGLVLFLVPFNFILLILKDWLKSRHIKACGLFQSRSWNPAARKTILPYRRKHISCRCNLPTHQSTLLYGAFSVRFFFFFNHFTKPYFLAKAVLKDWHHVKGGVCKTELDSVDTRWIIYRFDPSSEGKWNNWHIMVPKS